MSELSKVLGGTNTTVLPGWILSRFRLRDFAEVSQEFVREYLETGGKAAAKLPAAVGETLLDKMSGVAASGRLTYPSREFSLLAFSPPWLPFLLFVCLKIKHGTVITPEKADELVTEENQDVLHAEVLKCMRYNFSPNAGGAPVEKTTALPPNPQTGPESSSSSDTSESSVGEKSAT